MEATETLIPRVKLGNQGLEVSKLGFGCMGLTGVYNNPLSDEAVISIIKDCFNKGITFFDTADVYGATANEILVGKALKHLPREKVQLATKCGIVRMEQTGMIVKGTPEYVRACCEASLKRLDVEYIDLFYQHRIDTSIPIEDTMGEYKKLVEEGKELGIGIVPYSPLGRGFFAGKAVVESLPASSFLGSHPRFVGENFDKNKMLYMRLANFAEKHACSPAQLALAWLLHQGDDVIPIPGTTKIKNLDENIGSTRVKLTEEEVKEIYAAVPIDEVAGARIYQNLHSSSWKFANTPAK